MCWALIRSAMDFFVNISSGEPIEYTPPNPHGVFYGFSNFYYTSSAFNVSKLIPEQLDSFNQSVSKRCSMDWNEVESTDDSYYKAFRCIDGMFLLHALGGMGFTNNSKNQWTISFQYQVNDIFIGWSLGYMLDKSSSFISSYYFTRYPYTTVDLIVGMIVLLILSLIFAIFFAFTCSACSKSLRPTKSGYTNIT
ncbi:PREDICTED: ectonucleoside triphosphate diphosphohydrolase 3-like [Amphimedon queenslandica]|uniref:Uncharacterized protein n=1 Tax=Amphimedon queenslandica TaxID=400682 RepID=A0A1X7SHT1_AMPQE|nr:PREDICTED: ectonucleoside triphosphate diphosphohydrolase 3-like [Amphimedon queenslandica]|eukprot:XP_011409358.2 PREDICTED: ectonucleoside triphosphate diphosphohydrolase 3-like [Amphimedon queenslandica]